ncbi:hypothetical protein CIPAW_07G070000 [Carya illinoinensis]|uniref:Uncharacterized protein n=1 Tax=Carya illinoinensis TaxID=32201 RepID=A0A8T1PT13_CARIL|nr:hypothetical protein CIPAW_07G070000 [Carya illinoinensis]
MTIHLTRFDPDMEFLTRPKVSQLPISHISTHNRLSDFLNCISFQNNGYFRPVCFPQNEICINHTSYIDVPIVFKKWQ